MKVVLTASSQTSRDGTGVRALARALDMLSGLEGVFSPMVFTDDPAAASLADSRCVPCLTGGFPAFDPSMDILPPGSLAALDALVASGQATSREPVLLMDGYADNLDEQMLLKGRELLDGSGAALVLGVCVCRDNPVQCDEYYAIAAMNIVVFLEEPGMLGDGVSAGDGLAVTRPFGFPWKRFGYYGCRKDQAFTCFQGEALAPGSSDYEDLDGAGMLLFQDQDKARRVVRLAGGEELPGKLRGITVFPGAGVMDFILLELEGEHVLYVDSSLWSHGWRLHARPLHDHSQDLALWSGGDFFHPGLYPESLVTFGGGSFSGPFPISSPVDGPLLVTLLKPSGRDGAADIQQPLLLESGLWEYDLERHHRVKTDTGQLVSGRQEFPEYFMPCPVIALGRPDDLAMAKQLVIEGRVQGLVIEECAGTLAWGEDAARRSGQ